MKIFQKIKELSFIIGILLLSGCLQVPEITQQSNLNSYPFYITSGLGFPPVKKVSFNMEYIDYHPIDQRIRVRLRQRIFRIWLAEQSWEG